MAGTAIKWTFFSGMMAFAFALEGGAAVSFACETSEPRANMFVQGEDIYLYFTATGLKCREKGVSAALVVKDADGKVVHEKSDLHVEVNDAGVGTASYRISWSLRRLGFYRAYATLSDGTRLPAVGSRPEGYVTFAILRDPGLKRKYSMPYTHFMAEGGGWRGFMAGGAWRQHQSGGQWRQLEHEGIGSYAKNPGADKVILRESLKKEGPVRPGELRNDYGLANLLPGVSPNWPRTTEFYMPASIKSVRVPMLNTQGLEAWRDYCDTLSKNWAKQFADHPIHLYQVLWEQDPVYGESTWDDFKNIYRIAYETIHLNDPKACILLMPNDIAENLCNGMGEYADAISNHSYCGFPVEANGLVERCRRQLRMIRELSGKEMPIYGTEFGFSTAGLMENEALQMYGMVRGSLIMLGEGWRSNSLFKGADYRGEQGYGINYNLDYGEGNNDWLPLKTSPKPAMPALDAMINFVEGHVSVGPVEFLGETALGYVLKAEDGHVVMPLWDYGKGSEATVEVGREQIEVADMMGNVRKVKTPGGRLHLSLGEAPQYVLDVNPETWTRARLDRMNAEVRAARTKASFKPVLCEAMLPMFGNGSCGLSVRLAAQGGKAASGTLEVRLPGWPECRKTVPFALHADETKVFSVVFGEMDVNALDEIPVEIAVVTPGRTDVFRDEVNYLFAKRMRTPAFDGGDDEWRDVRAWRVDDTKATRGPQWHKGADDVRADVRIGWNEDYLLFFVRTEDDVFLQEETGWKTWDWDCLQMGFTKNYRMKDTNNMWLDAQARCRTEIDFALTKNGPETYRAMTWDKKNVPIALLDPAKARLGIRQRKLTNGRIQTDYEIGLRWELLGRAKAQAGDRIGWALAILDKDSADRTEQLYPSMIGAFSLKKPMEFGMITLGD